MIIKEAIGVGGTVEAAREDAINKLNAGMDEDVKFDIIAIQKKKVLGIFGGSDAKVRAYVEAPDKAPEKHSDKSRAKAPERGAAPKNGRGPQKTERRQGSGPQNQRPPRNEQREKHAERPMPERAAEKPAGVPAEQLDPASQAGKACAYLSAVLEKLGCSGVSATVREIENGAEITLSSDEKLGVIIGRRGETLDALQYLTSLAANERGSGYYRVVIDTGNYRQKREDTLESLAVKTARQVLRTGRVRSLEPMNPYERRVIHTAIQNIEGVTSTSVGSGSDRRVVISPEGHSSRPQGGHGERSAARPAKDAETDTIKRPKETDGTKLYGRLDK